MATRAKGQRRESVRGRVLGALFGMLYRNRYLYWFASTVPFAGQWRVWQRLTLPRIRGTHVLEIGCGPGKLLAGGTHSKRFALPNSTILIHQPLGGAEGQAADIEITAREIIRLRDALYNILVKHTGQSIERIKQDSDRNYYMKAEDALKYGIIDEILTPSEENALTH